MGIGRRQIAFGLRVIDRFPRGLENRGTAPDIGRITLRERREIAGVAGQAVQAQQRRPVDRARIVAKVEPEAVATVK